MKRDVTQRTHRNWEVSWVRKYRYDQILARICWRQNSCKTRLTLFSQQITYPLGPGSDSFFLAAGIRNVTEKEKNHNLFDVGEIFQWASKVSQNLFGFTALFSVIGLNNSHHPLDQSDTRIKTTATWAIVFSHAFSSFLVFILSSHWLTIMLIFVMSGRWEYLGFSFFILSWKLL